MMSDDAPRQTILVVDDTPDNLKLMSELLKERYRVKIANSGSKALALAAAGGLDLILLDVMMPEMDGYEVCGRLKAEPETRSIPIVFLTAKAEVEDEERGLRLGAVDYIAKPISPPIVMARVATHLSLKAAHDEIAAARDRAETALADLKTAQDRLVEAGKQAALTGLVAGIAHEINTPVGIALTAATTLDDETAKLRQAVDGGLAKKSHVTAYLDIAAESTRLIAEHCRNASVLIQSFKKIAVDQSSDERRPLDLGGYLADIVRSLKPELKKTRVTLSLDCPPGLVAETYPGALGQIVTNLVINAVIHAFDEGREAGLISLTAAEGEGGIVEIRHADSGRGVPREIAGRIFEPFFTTRRGRGGSGLGLGIVHNLVTQQLHGSIRLEETVGGGACFVITFPKTSREEQ